MRVLQRATPTVTRGIRYHCHLRRPVTQTYCRAFGSGAVTTCFYFRSWDSNIQPSAYPLRQRRGNSCTCCVHQVHTEALDTFTPLIEYKNTRCAQYLPLELRVFLLVEFILLQRRVIKNVCTGVEFHLSVITY